VNDENWSFETICQHLGEDYRFEGAVVPPIFQNSLFVFETADSFVDRTKDRRVFDYTRINNPTTDVAERKLAALEKTEKCRIFSSGMAAISAAIMSCTKAGSHVVCTDAAYGPTLQFLREYMPKFGVETSFVDGRDTDAVEGAIRENTTLIYLESPGSFYYHMQDIGAIAGIAKSRGIATIIDNSNASPYFQNPAEFGIDLVAHTATKYLGGHSDIVLGAVCGSEERMSKILENEGALLGANADPFASWLLIRSLRTLAIRMERIQQSAMSVAQFLDDHVAVSRVYYTGLPSHPGHDLVAKQMRGTSGMISFEPAFQSKEKVYAFCEGLRLFQIGVSWGGHESLAIPLCDPNRGDTWFVRMSVGLENVEDLLEDLDRELKLAAT
jgi:cystathionine beta-lyase/cystathionine gamma-synthase